MAELYDEHFSMGRVVEVVADEVRAWATAWVAPGDPQRISGVRRAGASAVNRYQSSLLAALVPTPVPDPAEVAVILQELEDYANRRRPGRTPRTGEHGGETYSIYEAEQRPVVFISNDDGARHVADAHGVTHESFADIARRLAKCQREVKPKQIVRELQGLMRDGVDTGDVVNSVLDLG